jgi:hypothetical protein
MEKAKEASPGRGPFVVAGALLGLVVACAAIFLLPVNGILPGLLVGMGGPLLGVAVARAIGWAVTRRKG